MSYRDTCGLCGESFDDENLTTCTGCRREFCYRCGDAGAGLCSRCRKQKDTPQPADGSPKPRR
jgi:uncharacterized UBP type Zn finger protein